VWKIIKNNSGYSQPGDVVTKINSEEGMLMDNKETANAFNKYEKIAKKLNNKLTNTSKASLLLKRSNFIML
jgi:hypothetical protein